MVAPGYGRRMPFLAYPPRQIPHPHLSSPGWRVIDDPPVRHAHHVLVGPDPQAVVLAASHLEKLKPDLLVPGTEESVLAVGLANSHLDQRGVTLDVALKCSDRYLQRLALEPTGLNPAWAPWPHIPAPGPLVVKAPASTLSRGVEVVDHAGQVKSAGIRVLAGAKNEIARLRLAGRAPKDLAAVVEAFIPGEAYEVSGISRDRIVHTFHPLHQRWDRPAGTIQRYTPAEPDGLVAAAHQAVEALGLSWCGWCVELKGPPWKVVEIHCRLGEDGPGSGWRSGNPVEYGSLQSPDIPPFSALCAFLSVS